MDKKKCYKCIKCGEIYPLNKKVLNCTKHSPYYSYLDLVYDYSKVTFPRKEMLSQWTRYLDLLPIEEFKISFNEQKTPLVKLENLGENYTFKNLYAKDESKNPTNSFKDKESSCAINKALEWDIDKIFVVSSGNAALSTASYAQKADIKCDCIVPRDLSVGKRLLIELYGGNIVEVDGNYEYIYRWSIDSQYPGWNCTPGINPIKEEGVKIIGFEIWEGIGVPDAIVAPCGNGTLLYGLYKAFKELQLLGLVDSLPKMIGVQVKGTAPLKIALEKKKEAVKLTNIPESIAEGIIAEESYSSPKAVLALQDTGGQIIEVTDREIAEAMQEVIKFESLIPEPTSASVYAGVRKLEIDKENTIVLIQSAGGMKNLEEIGRMIARFPIL